jgi:hypothetical protein
MNTHYFRQERGQTSGPIPSGFGEMPIKTKTIPIQGGVDATLCHTRSKESSALIRNKAIVMVYLMLRVK